MNLQNEYLAISIGSNVNLRAPPCTVCLVVYNSCASGEPSPVWQNPSVGCACQRYFWEWNKYIGIPDQSVEKFNTLKQQWKKVLPACAGKCSNAPNKGWVTTGITKKRYPKRKRVSIDLRTFTPRPLTGEHSFGDWLNDSKQVWNQLRSEIRANRQITKRRKRLWTMLSYFVVWVLKEHCGIYHSITSSKSGWLTLALQDHISISKLVI